MSIKIDIPYDYYELTNGNAVVEVNGNTVGECLYDLVRQFPEIKPVIFDANGKLLKYLDIYHNLECFPDQLSQPVKDGDQLTITLYTVTGG